MGVRLNKFRQVLNLFLILALLSVVAGIFVYFLTLPEQRKETTFWMSIGLLFFAFLLATLFAARIVYSDDDRQPSYTFTQYILVCVYILFVIAAIFSNAFLKMSVQNYFLLHLAGGVFLLLPIQLVNMASIKSGGAKQEAREARKRLYDASARVKDLVARVEEAKPTAARSLTSLRKLADDLYHSEPSQALHPLEQSLDRFLDELQVRGEMLLASSEQESDAGFEELTRAALAADRALKSRNEAVLRAK